jgi:hypothetical protein
MPDVDASLLRAFSSSHCWMLNLAVESGALLVSGSRGVMRQGLPAHFGKSISAVLRRPSWIHLVWPLKPAILSFSPLTPWLSSLSISGFEQTSQRKLPSGEISAGMSSGRYVFLHDGQM